jgi:hypothetical protein
VENLRIDNIFRNLYIEIIMADEARVEGPQSAQELPAQDFITKPEPLKTPSMVAPPITELPSDEVKGDTQAGGQAGSSKDQAPVFDDGLNDFNKPLPKYDTDSSPGNESSAQGQPGQETASTPAAAPGGQQTAQGEAAFGGFGTATSPYREKYGSNAASDQPAAAPDAAKPGGSTEGSSGEGTGGGAPGGGQA